MPVNHQGAHAQGYAVSIEHILCNVFECERLGFSGIVNSDFIRKQPFSSIACGLRLYMQLPQKKNR